MKRWDIINHLIKKYNYKTYLEIGLWAGECFGNIQCANKDNVDPDPRWQAKYQMTADEFFEKHAKQKYDLIFIDGDHSTEQVLKDIDNALKWITDSGTIVIHDCGESNLTQNDWPNCPGPKAICIFNTIENGFKCYVVDTDNGCGVIQKGFQEKTRLLREEAIKWENRRLNHISADEFYILI
jgi:hypothetical protein